MTRPALAQLQLALDVPQTSDALRICEQVSPHFDIAEIGTPLLIEDGLAALEAVKTSFPGKEYLADTKIADAGYIEAASAFRRGASIATVLAVADNRTIEGALEAAREFSCEIMADLMHVPERLERARELEALGVPIICLHTAYDIQDTGVDPMADLLSLRAALSCRLAIAGGLTIENVGRAAALGADIVVVGGGIITQPSPRHVAKRIHEAIKADG